jgi:hypothetical protein
VSFGDANPPQPRRWRKKLLIGVGIVVVIFIVLIVVGATTKSAPPSRPTKAAGLVRLRYGQKALLSSGWTADGIVSATVYSLQLPFTSQTSNTPDAGDQFAVGSAQVCAGPHGANTASSFLPFPFSLVYPGSQTFGMLDSPDAAREPDIANQAATLPPSQCVHGYLTFQYAKGTTPLAVGWGSPDQPSYEWSAAATTSAGGT